MCGIMWGMRMHPLLEAWDGAGDDRSDGHVVLCEGMVISGWERLRVMRESGRWPVFRSIGPRDPVDYVLGEREWMPAGKEKTLGVAKCAMWLAPGRPSSARLAAIEKGVLSLMTAKEMAQRAGVSIRSVVRRKKELREELLEEGKRKPVDWRKRCGKLEKELRDTQLALQSMADRGLRESDMERMVRNLNVDRRVYRDRLRQAQHKVRTADVELKRLRRTERRLNAKADRQRAEIRELQAALEGGAQVAE